MKNKLRHHLLNKLFGISEKSVFSWDSNGRPRVDGEIVTFDQLSTLEQEAKYIQSTWLWKLLTESLEFRAQKAIFEKSQTIDDIIFGKAILYSVDIQRKMVDNIRKQYAEASKETTEKSEEKGYNEKV